MLSSGLNTVLSVIKGGFGANGGESAVKSADSASGDSFASAFSEASAQPSSSSVPRSVKAVSTDPEARSSGTSLPSEGENLPPGAANGKKDGLGQSDLAPADSLSTGQMLEVGAPGVGTGINASWALSLPADTLVRQTNGREHAELTAALATNRAALDPATSISLGSSATANTLSDSLPNAAALPSTLQSLASAGELEALSKAPSGPFNSAALSGLLGSASPLRAAPSSGAQVNLLGSVDDPALSANLPADSVDLAPLRALGERLMSDLQRSPSQLAGQANGKMAEAVGLVSDAPPINPTLATASAVMTAAEQAMDAKLNPAVNTLTDGLVATSSSPLARAEFAVNQPAADVLPVEAFLNTADELSLDNLDSAERFDRALNDAKISQTIGGREASNTADASGGPRAADGFATSLNHAATTQRTTDVPTMASTLVDDLNHAPDSAEFPDEVMTKLRLLQDGGRHEARLNLHPAELGRLQISVTTDGDSTKVAFTVDNPQARDALEQAMPRLRELLAQSGLALSEGTVFEQGQQAQQDQALADAGAQGRHNGAAMSASGDAGEASNLNSDDVAQAQASTALLDAYA